jgi:hypothetical protein
LNIHPNERFPKNLPFRPIIGDLIETLFNHIDENGPSMVLGIRGC